MNRKTQETEDKRLKPETLNVGIDLYISSQFSNFILIINLYFTSIKLRSKQNHI